MRETRSGTAEKTRCTDEGHKVRCCREDSMGWGVGVQYGVAFITWKKVVGSIISYTPISRGLIPIRISVRPHNITVILVYSPTPDHEGEEVKQFYKQLDSILAKTPEKDILVKDDSNATVGHAEDLKKKEKKRNGRKNKEKKQILTEIRNGKVPAAGKACRATF